MTVVRLAVAGAGLVGRRHAAIIAAGGGTDLAAIADPSDAGREVAGRLDVPWFAEIGEMLESVRPAGVVIATPNQLHLEHGLAAIRSGIPALIEKPIADTVAAAEELVRAAAEAGVPLLVGHHRRHNPLIRRAKAAIESGELGRLVAVHGFFWICKPGDYYDTDWRRRPGAGPVLINLIHDIDLLRHLVGDVTSVQAIESNAVRGFEVEDTATALMRFANGALGTISVSDTITAPWSWEQTAGENPAYPQTDQPCYVIGGTRGSISLPQCEVWSAPGESGWWEPLARNRVHAPPADPLVLQIEHFRRVIADGEAPLVPGSEGLAALKVIEAFKTSARERREVTVG